MKFKFADDVTLQQMFDEMDKIREMGFDCHLKGTGDGGLSLVIEIIGDKTKKSPKLNAKNGKNSYI